MASLADVPATAEALLAAFPSSRVFTFMGDLGAGKTTLIKGLCTALGVPAGTSSPSFAIVNEYSGTQGPVYHFDLYRLEEPQELEGIGFTEYIDSGHFCFVEWPELAADLFAPGTVHLSIAISPEGIRTISPRT